MENGFYSVIHERLCKHFPVGVNCRFFLVISEHGEVARSEFRWVGGGGRMDGRSRRLDLGWRRDCVVLWRTVMTYSSEFWDYDAVGGSEGRSLLFADPGFLDKLDCVVVDYFGVDDEGC